MASVAIRNLDDDVEMRLRVRAAERKPNSQNLASIVRSHFGSANARVGIDVLPQDRLEVIDRLEILKDDDNTDENDLQRLIADAPWLINPEWAPVTENQTFSSLRREFEKYYEDKTGQSISLSDFQETGKRPDFVLSNQEGTVQIIEIKKPRHRLSNAEMDRIVSYYDNMKAFLDDPGHSLFSKYFQDFHITVVCDNLGLTGAQRAAFEGYRSEGKLTHMDWTAFLFKSEQVH